MDTIRGALTQSPLMGLFSPLYAIFLLRIILLNQLIIHNWRIGKINSVYGQQVEIKKND